MITEEKCYLGTCDNCGEVFDDGQFSLFISKSDVKERMEETNWYADGTDPDHKGKHYCQNCFKHNDEIDDKIIVDYTRKKINQ